MEVTNPLMSLYPGISRTEHIQVIFLSGFFLSSCGVNLIPVMHEAAATTPVNPWSAAPPCWFGFFQPVYSLLCQEMHSTTPLNPRMRPMKSQRERKLDFKHFIKA